MATVKPFSPKVVAVLQSLYQRGMTGWGIKHSKDLESAVKSTGLNHSQVKVCMIVRYQSMKIYSNEGLVC